MRIIQLSFNTSHVTLYRYVGRFNRIWFEFQYISCYSLSQVNCFSLNKILRFQYISCYSLSQIKEKSCEQFNKFQYISCYSLSRKKLMWSVERFVSIHLMLLFIWKPWIWKFGGKKVSIHLMLLFIGIRCTHGANF